MNAKDQIEVAIMNVIDNIGKNAVATKKLKANQKGTDWKKIVWKDKQATIDILCGLRDLGHQTKYQVAADLGKCNNADRAEWLYDLVWYRGSTGNLTEVALAVEIEWATRANSPKERLDKILYDFEKLLVARTKYKVIIFQGISHFNLQTFNTLKNSIKSYGQTGSGDRYLFAGWSFDNQIFHFDHLVIP